MLVNGFGDILPQNIKKHNKQLGKMAKNKKKTKSKK